MVLSFIFILTASVCQTGATPIPQEVGEPRAALPTSTITESVPSTVTPQQRRSNSDKIR